MLEFVVQFRQNIRVVNIIMLILAQKLATCVSQDMEARHGIRKVSVPFEKILCVLIFRNDLDFQARSPL